MLSHLEEVSEGEPPSIPSVGTGRCGGRVDRLMAMAHLPAAVHVALIGRHTLPLLIDLLEHGCEGVRCLRPGTPAPDCEAADLAWIVDVGGDDELDEALRAARARIGTAGRIVVEGGNCACRTGPSAIAAHAAAAGLSVISFDHKDNRVLLARGGMP